MTEQLLEVEDLSKRYWLKERGWVRRRCVELRAVDRISFSIAPGNALGLVGESGCGKTTTAMMLLRLEQPSGGAIRFKGTDLTCMTKSEVRRYRASVQAVLQDPWSSLSPRLTVGSIIDEPLRVHTNVRQRSLPHGPCFKAIAF